MRGKFPRSSLSGKDSAVNLAEPKGDRPSAVERAERHSPFLREAMAARPDITEAFVERGARAAASEALATKAEGDESELRCQRQALALAVALGDLSGEMSLEQVTTLLSDFADRSINRAVEAAIAERTPGEEPCGLAVIALGKLGSRELNFSSDVDLILLFDPETLPRRQRDEPGEAAVRIARRGPAPSALTRSHAYRASCQRGDFLLRVRGPRLGESGLHPRPLLRG
jgi:glutamate-ammonia-ligase adenylyltransferase